MNTRALNALADVICRAQKLDRTPMGIAFAIDTAGMHQSPATAAEHAALRKRVDDVERMYIFDTAALKKRVAELEAERHSTNEALSDAAEQLRVQRDRIAELEALPDGWPDDARLVTVHTIWQLDEWLDDAGVFAKPYVEYVNGALRDTGLRFDNGSRRVVAFIGDTIVRHEDGQHTVLQAADAAEMERLRARVAELEALTPAKYQTCTVCGAGYEYGFPCSACAFKARMAAEAPAPDPVEEPLHHATAGELAEQQHLVDPLDHDFERLATNLNTHRGTR